MSLKIINPNYKKESVNIDVADLSEKILMGDVIALSQGITLLEKSSFDDLNWVENLLLLGQENIKKSIRIGITGPPGVGKSSFINCYTAHLLEKGHKVAVLAIDPSSSITNGSILGDKTRMDRIGNHKNAFIRPSPTNLNLGGIRPSTLASIQLCEAAGFDHVLIESVGVGQSEVDINTCVDLMCLLFLPGSGDDIQSIKKGVMELSDVFIVHKNDGDLEDLAEEKYRILKQSMSSAAINRKPLIKFSSIINDKLEELDTLLLTEIGQKKASGQWITKRNWQLKFWLKKEMMGVFSKFIEEHPIFVEKFKQTHDTLDEKEILPLSIRNDFYSFLSSKFPTE